MVFRDNLEQCDGRGMGGRFQREGTYAYLRLIYADEWQKPTDTVKQLPSN